MSMFGSMDTFGMQKMNNTQQLGTHKTLTNIIITTKEATDHEK